MSRKQSTAFDVRTIMLIVQQRLLNSSILMALPLLVRTESNPLLTVWLLLLRSLLSFRWGVQSAHFYTDVHLMPFASRISFCFVEFENWSSYVPAVLLTANKVSV
jgi:hypothetical protein